MGVTSFQKTATDGWRYAVSHRARRTRAGWEVQRWNGSDWETVATTGSYWDARVAASDPSDCPFCAPDEACAHHVNREGNAMGAQWEYLSLKGWLPIPAAMTEREAKAWFRRRFNVGRVRAGQIRRVAS